MRSKTTFAALALLTACAQSPSDPPMTALEVHHSYIIPNADILFAAESDPPTTDTGWAELADRAAVVREAVLKLKMVSEVNADTGWNDAVDLVSTRAEAIVASIATKDSFELMIANGDMLEACTACHSAYRD